MLHLLGEKSSNQVQLCLYYKKLNALQPCCDCFPVVPVLQRWSTFPCKADRYISYQKFKVAQVTLNPLYYQQMLIVPLRPDFTLKRTIDLRENTALNFFFSFKSHLWPKSLNQSQKICFVKYSSKLCPSKDMKLSSL